MKWKAIAAGALCVLCAGCGKETPEAVPEADSSGEYFSLEDVAMLLSSVQLGGEQMEEVHDAVASSGANGYDHEYLMKDIFGCPGAGIGDTAETKAPGKYKTPLRDLLSAAVLETKSGIGYVPALLDSLAVSDVQIYWPYAERWDGESLPVITFDPSGDYSVTVNSGYLPNGEKVLVDEQMAMERPVWVVSKNTDAGFPSLEMLRRQDPSWGQGGGDIYVKAAKTEIKTLVLHSFKSYRQFDSWFAGGSEYFVKMGSVADFSASTEAEMRVYKPAITDFMIVLKRSDVGQEIPFNAILISEWVKGLDKCAFMISEDDGGTMTSWKCDLNVKYNSKTYGVEINIPIKSRDDIVWRGTLTRAFIEKNSGNQVNFGDVELVLELI